MPRSPHSSLLLAPLALVLALATLLPVATASATTSATTSATPTTPATRADDVITGWADAPTTVRARSTYAARVWASGGSRPVRLQRMVGTTWRTVATTTSTSSGVALLRWRTPRSATRAVLRVQVPREGSHAAMATPAKNVKVRAASTVLTGTLTPLLRDVLGLVNAARATARTCGGVRYPAVGPLKTHARLARAADKYARRMAAEDFFSHTAPDGTGPGDRIEAEGYQWRTWGENIAAGQRTAADVVQGWIESAGHCANIMNPSFKEIGLGYGYDASSTYGTYWVQDFGAR